MKKLLLMSVLLCVLLSLLSSCSTLKKNIVGQWECEVPGEKIFTYDFLSDGTGNYTENSNEYSFTYKVRSDKVKITLNNGAESYELSYEDEKLIFKKGENELIFIKRDSKT